jgi:hypothetical protein
MPLNRKSGTGLKHYKVTKSLREKIISKNVAEVSKSYQSLGRKFNLGSITVKNVLVSNEVIRKKRKKCPKSDQKQKLRQKKCLNKLTKTFLKPSNNLSVVMDDESYFSIDSSNSYGNDYYFEYSGLETPDSVKYKPVSKYPKYVLV